MIDIRGLEQGADYMLEIPFTLDGVQVSSAIAVQFDVYKGDAKVLTKNLCNGLTLQGGMAYVPILNSETLNMAGAHDCEFWLIPASEPNKKHFIDRGKIYFSKTNSRIIPCL